MTVKELQNELRKEKYDTKHTPVYVVIEGEKFLVESVEKLEDGVHITVGEEVE